VVRGTGDTGDNGRDRPTVAIASLADHYVAAIRIVLTSWSYLIDRRIIALRLKAAKDAKVPHAGLGTTWHVTSAPAWWVLATSRTVST
jgi:hypothetical protein